jgi:hypothetical protein
MPLPLPNLDDRRWTDLVEEGRALIPMFARAEPRWTDHNIHDPGIMLMELFAWLTEMNIYRLNRVPERHRRKFLALVGFNPRPPRAARALLSISPKAETTLPAGVEFETPQLVGPNPRFRTLHEVTVVPVRLAAIQVDDGSGLRDHTRALTEGLPFTVFGEDPKPDTEKGGPSFYLGFSQPLPTGVPITLFLRFEGPQAESEERERIIQETMEAREACRPPLPNVECEPKPARHGERCESAASSEVSGAALQPVPLPPHHSARTVWEVFVLTGVPPTPTPMPTPTPPPAAPGLRVVETGEWVPLSEVEDDTRSFTLGGTVRMILPIGLQPRKSIQGKVPETLYYLRCRLQSGQYDAPPRLLDVVPNGVMVEQAVPVGQWEVIIAAGVVPTGPAPRRGETTRLRLSLLAGRRSDPAGNRTARAGYPRLPNDDKDIATLVAFEPEAVDLPQFTVLEYLDPAPNQPGRLVLELERLGRGTGLPLQQLALSGTLVQGGSLRLYTLEKEGEGEAYLWREWLEREDLDASSPTDPHFRLDPTTGEVTFGTGKGGRVPPPGTWMVGAYRETAAGMGNVAAGTISRLADTPHNRAIVPDVNGIRERLGAITNRAAATDGAEAENVDQAAGRAIEALWAHEQLLSLCAPPACQSLDQLPRHTAAAVRAPQRAISLPDFERLALNVPGTQVARARAWANLHPAYPCVRAPGVVTVVVMPYLPTARPEPSPGLLAMVRHYLQRRRVVTTRIEVIGPMYLEVRVRAKVQALPGASPARVREDVIQALNNFLRPLADPPHKTGWPFGRDVYRSEVLQAIDDVAGVDHVLSLDLIPDDGEPQCGNLRLCPTWLVTPGIHDIEVMRG